MNPRLFRFGREPKRGGTRRVFALRDAAGGAPGAVICTGSKQGITCPPGNAAYNVSKSGVKSYTEALAHDLRQHEGCAISTHLLVPGFTLEPAGGGKQETTAPIWVVRSSSPLQWDLAQASELLNGSERPDPVI